MSLESFDCFEHAPHEWTLMEWIGIAKLELCRGYAVKIVSDGGISQLVDAVSHPQANGVW